MRKISVKFESRYNNFHFKKCIWKLICKLVTILLWPQGVQTLIMFVHAETKMDDLINNIFIALNFGQISFVVLTYTMRFSSFL